MKKIVLCIFLLIFLPLSGCLAGIPSPAGIPPAAGTKYIADDAVYRIPVVMYHRVYSEKNGQYCITPHEFESDLKYLHDNGYETVTISEILDFKDGKFVMPVKPVVLTFDDGHYNNFTEVFPLLKKYKAKATFFVIGEFAERFSDGRRQHPATSHASFENLREMTESGLCEIGNHTYDMHDWTRGRFGVGKKKEEETFADYRTALEKDIMKNQRLIFDKIGVVPRSFAYPFGEYNADAEKILAGFGFRAMATANEGVNIVSQIGPDNLARIRRVNRPHGITAEEFFKKNFSVLFA